MRCKITLLLLIISAMVCGQTLPKDNPLVSENNIFILYADGMDADVEATTYRSERLFTILQSDTVNSFLGQFIHQRSSIRKKILRDCRYPIHDLIDLQRCIRNIQENSTRPDVTRQFVQQLQMAADDITPQTRNLPLDSIRTAHNGWAKAHRVFPTVWNEETKSHNSPICMQQYDTLFIITNDQRYFNDTSIWAYNSSVANLRYVFNQLQPRPTATAKSRLSVRYDLDVPASLILSTGKDAMFYKTNDNAFAFAVGTETFALQPPTTHESKNSILLDGFILTDTILTFADIRIGQSPQDVCHLFGLDCPQGIRYIVLLNRSTLLLPWESEESLARDSSNPTQQTLEGVFISFQKGLLYRIESCYQSYTHRHEKHTLIERITHSGWIQENWCNPLK